MVSRKAARWWEAVWLLVCLGASSAWCVSASTRLGATFDEPTYVRLGLESWRTGTSRRLLDLGTMPLPVHLQTLPLRLWEVRRGVPFDVDRDLDCLLPVARLGTLPFWWLLLIYGWWVGRRLAGARGGTMAVAFLACEPNLLAHATLATTDVAVTACLLALLFHFRAGREGTWPRRVGLPAAWFALAVLAKASGLVFGLLGLAAVEAGRCAAAEPGAGRRVRAAVAAVMSRRFVRDTIGISLLGLTAAFVYCGTDWEPSPSFVRWAHELPGGPARATFVWLAEHLCIFSNAGMALARQVRHNVQGHGVFIMGQVAPRALWYYFPAALAIKVALPLLALPVLLGALRPRALASWPCGVALALLAFSLVCRVQTGVRLVLPLVTLAAVGLAAGIARATTGLTGGRRRLLAVSGVVAGLWMGWSSLHAWPQGLCFINELWGGSARGYRLLSDSNYDWGQGLKELARWQRGHRLGEISVLYYGTDPRISRLPMRRLGSPPPKDPSAVEAALRGRTLAVGTTLLYGSVSDWPSVRPWVRYLRRRRPVDRTATFLIYRFPAGDEVASGAVAAVNRP
jgi:hypothetical protein